MIKPKEIIKTGFILFIITAISAFLLAFGNQITSPIIAKNNKAKTEAAMQKVLPQATEFEATGYADIEVYIGKSGGEIVGACAITTAHGYGGEINVICGVDKDGKIVGIDILNHSETPGLGANATKPEFKSQFAGKTENIAVSRGKAEGNEINAMSGATITSNAVTEAVNQALRATGKSLEDQLKEGIQ